MGMWIQCRCKAVFSADEENAAWEKHRQHVENEVLRGTGIGHDVVASGKPFTYPEPPEPGLASTLKWVAETVHDRYHDEAGGYELCSQVTCMAAIRALRSHGHEHTVSMPSVFPEVQRAPGFGDADPGAHAGPPQEEGQHRLGERPVE